ncbi:MAG: hypothetical protein IT582_05525 [Opitutaceae bacterium]|nr:hypothetical protein [Opitutaceae bacterium]
MGILLAALSACVCAGNIPAPPPKPTEVDLLWFYEALNNADQLEILEGLPHHYWEPVEREIEISKHPTTTIAKQVFYSQRLPADKEFKAKLTTGFLCQNLFIPHKPGDLIAFKQCGGFHADYGLQWLKEGELVAAALICFGCGEIQIVGGKMDILADMTEEGGDFFARALKPLHALRPPFLHQHRLQELKPHVPKIEPPEKVIIQPQ